MMKKIIFCNLFIFSCLISFSAVRLPSILASGMVMQRNSVVKIWGWADRGEVITVSASWLVEPAIVTTGEGGKWVVSIPTGPAGGPHSMTITGTNRIVLKDILFGEVWICSGQSNMEFTIKMLGGWKKYKDAKRDLRKTNYTQIRLCQVAHARADVPQDSCKTTWGRANTATVAGFSATAWFFGRELFNMLHVPIGLISANIGGTPAESWTDRKYLEADQNLNFFLKSPNSIPDHFRDASVLYNAMIHPLLNYRIKGAIWYQGESNRLQADLYQDLFSTMIRNWRDGWDEGDFPFYYVQIAPFDYGEKFNAAAFLREAQYKTLSVPNTGMVVTMDIGNPANIHPTNKQDVGLRLALLAFSKTYGMENIFCEGPVYNSMKVEGDRVRLFFKNAEGGLISKGERLTCFTMAGKDHVFHPADAKIDSNSVVLRCHSVSAPVSVRYAFADADSVNLFNLAGLPAVPFRTDLYPFFIRPVSIAFSNDSITGLKKVTMKSQDTTCQVRFTLDGTDPDSFSGLYEKPILLHHSCTISARAFKGSRGSEQVFHSKYTLHAGINRQITTDYPFDEKFAGGTNALLDGVRGSKEFTDGCWQGYQGVDFVATIDLGETISVKDISAGFLQNSGSWIFLPTQVTYYFSKDGVEYSLPITVKTIDSRINMESEPFLYEYQWKEADVERWGGYPQARFVRIVAKNIGVCPKWHPGRGGKAWLFVDEVIINHQ